MATTPRTTKAAPSAPRDLPPLPADPASVDTTHARALSKTLFARLDSLEEGTAEFSYVRNSLVELNLALVRFAVGRTGVRGQSYEDVVQVGTIGLIKAINRFDPGRGVEFPTFALPTVLGEIKRYFRDSTWAVRVPRRLQELRIDLTRASAHLEQTRGHAPTVPELAAHLGLSEEEIIEGLVAANGYRASSLEHPNDTGDPEETLSGHIGFADPGLEKVEDLQTLQPLVAALPARERRILALRYGADMTQSAIGEELGISQMHVSRILSRTLSRLRAALVHGR
ncbi:SigB/SigF/SigG family RNA polymerase sigma factor [Streptomyces antnestii]|uniref:SigB/SigF/SigG family RNA polymerase sigma factor n=1 Tax=Streptomyces antnestii TaxID=2494256 RepID=A0A437PN17_9ACTN|nr:SigB/SigF/SigG family RNA polymerase sigma factor [Streptomyces sp. San01]RVU23657.1 SigB/SigF/SigG family RNA polymerase sigma factor [Streptomyces sp. San01]